MFDEEISPCASSCVQSLLMNALHISTSLPSEWNIFQGGFQSSWTGRNGGAESSPEISHGHSLRSGESTGKRFGNVSVPGATDGSSSQIQSKHEDDTSVEHMSFFDQDKGTTSGDGLQSKVRNFLQVSWVPKLLLSFYSFQEPMRERAPTLRGEKIPDHDLRVSLGGPSHMRVRIPLQFY